MNPAITFDSDAVARICANHGVVRLRIFGSVLTDRFDSASSDIDFIVDFLPGRENMFDDYSGLLEDLSALFGRDVDLVVGRTLRNPYFRNTVLGSAQDVYAA
ncbi:nucleotidyltransferase domain-containing protein [Brevibacterium ammoniilyticum]|uniref:Nucleotidyltransferase domain-containing protein n=1 Tax=Brevibacterium ammoniilyticum TaxID=1046555 RepID=A0ABP9U577_9MICO